MNWTKNQLWQRFQQHSYEFPSLGLSLDLSRVTFPEEYFTRMDGAIQNAFRSMDQLEAGSIANPDEKRMVGHYWLRNAALAPNQQIKAEIESTLAAIKTFSNDIHTGRISGQGGKFRQLLVVGIGGSALGPQFVAAALGHPRSDKLKVFFFDNTDPDGMDKVLAQLADALSTTLTLVISKSGGTKETRNGMLEAQAAYKRAGLVFEKHAVAITGDGSELDKYAKSNNWVARFPMWDWVGGRTSETSVVGLLPAALQGIDIERFLAGAERCDQQTRSKKVSENPSALLALMWYHLGNGRGEKDMVILPYKDRLELFSKYLQQLIMESLGKERDVNDNVVNQGIAVYGNKGSTDQHAYVQQLRDGVNNFFVTFIEVLKDRGSQEDLMVETEVTSGDYLNGFYQGTREALFQNNRQSITITANELSPETVGCLIALYERAVGFYATLVNINAYHQPGVEAGKKAAGEVISIQGSVLKYLRSIPGTPKTAAEIAAAIGKEESAEMVYKVSQHLSANPSRKIRKHTAGTVGSVRFEAI